jgi:hypothetical protein
LKGLLLSGPFFVNYEPGGIARHEAISLGLVVLHGGYLTTENTEVAQSYTEIHRLYFEKTEITKTFSHSKQRMELLNKMFRNPSKSKT